MSSESSKKSPESQDEVFVISVAAEITGMHAQTLRTYDRIGLVTPRRTRGGGRRYTQADIRQLQEIQRLSHEEGVNLAGIERIIELQDQVERLEQKVKNLTATIQDLENNPAGRPRGEIVHVPRSTSVVLWEKRRRKN